MLIMVLSTAFLFFFAKLAALIAAFSILFFSFFCLSFWSACLCEFSQLVVINTTAPPPKKKEEEEERFYSAPPACIFRVTLQNKTALFESSLIAES